MTNTARAIVSSPPSVAHPLRVGAEEALARIHRFVEDWRMPTRDKRGTFADFQKELHAKVMAFQREVLAEELARANVDVQPVVLEGVTYRTRRALPGHLRDGGRPPCKIEAPLVQGPERTKTGPAESVPKEPGALAISQKRA